MKSKYIIVKHGSSELPFVFSDYCIHADIARLFDGPVVGAGFCFIAEDRYHCYGESISCKVKSRYEADDAVLNRMLGVEA